MTLVPLTVSPPVTEMETSWSNAIVRPRDRNLLVYEIGDNAILDPVLDDCFVGGGNIEHIIEWAWRRTGPSRAPF